MHPTWKGVFPRNSICRGVVNVADNINPVNLYYHSNTILVLNSIFEFE
jgi:hypothetical protein